MSTQAHAQAPDQEIAAELAAIKRLLRQLVRKRGPDPSLDLSISEWCKKRRLSRAYWYVLKAKGRTPRTIGEGHRTRITPDADREWEQAEAARAAALEAAGNPRAPP